MSSRVRLRPSALGTITLDFSFLMLIKLWKLAGHPGHLLHKMDRLSNLLLDFLKSFHPVAQSFLFISFRDNV